MREGSMMGATWPIMISLALQTAFAFSPISSTRYARVALALLTVALAGILAVNGRPFSAIACIVGMVLCVFVIQKATVRRAYSPTARRYGLAAVWSVALVGGYIVLGALSLTLREQGLRGDLVFSLIAVCY